MYARMDLIAADRPDDPGPAHVPGGDPAHAAPRLFHRRPRERAVRGVRRGRDRRSRRPAGRRDQRLRTVLPHPRSPSVLRRTGARRCRSDRPGAGGRRGRADRRPRPGHPRGDLMLPLEVSCEARGCLRADLHALCRERGCRPRRPAVQPRPLRGDRDPRLPGAGVERGEPEPGGRREAARPRRCRAAQGARAGGPGRGRVRRAARGGGLPRGRGGPWSRFRARPVAGLLPGADDGRGPVQVLLVAGRRGADPAPPLQRPGLLRRHPEPGPGRAPRGPSEHRGPQGQCGERHRRLPALPGSVLPGPGGLGQLPLPGHDGRLAGRHGVAGQLLPGAGARAVRLRARSRRGQRRPAAGSGQPHQRGHLRSSRGGGRQGGHDPRRASGAASRGAPCSPWSRPRSRRCRRSWSRRVSSREPRHPRPSTSGRARSRSASSAPTSSGEARRGAPTHRTSTTGARRTSSPKPGGRRCASAARRWRPAWPGSASSRCPSPRRGSRRWLPTARRSRLPCCSSTDVPSAQSAAIRELVGERRFLAETCNLPVSGGSSLSSILWFRDEEPEVWAAAAKFGHCNTYLVKRMTGRWAIDPVDDVDHRPLQHGPQRPHLEPGGSRPCRHPGGQAAAASCIPISPSAGCFPASPMSSVSLATARCSAGGTTRCSPRCREA